METFVDGLDGLFGVDGGHGRYDHGFEAGVVQHLVVVVVDCDAPWCEPGLRPGFLVRVRGEGGHELGARHSLEEVKGVAGTHAAEACHGDLELADSTGVLRHGGCEVVV